MLSYLFYKKLELGELSKMNITILLANQLVKIPRKLVEDVLVQINNRVIYWKYDLKDSFILYSYVFIGVFFLVNMTN